MLGICAKSVKMNKIGVLPEYNSVHKSLERLRAKLKVKQTGTSLLEDLDEFMNEYNRQHLNPELPKSRVYSMLNYS